MAEKDSSDTGQRASITAIAVLGISVLGPVFIGQDQTNSQLVIFSVFWHFNSNSPGLRPTSFIEFYLNALLIIPRYIFTYQVYRYYENKTTLRRLVLGGLLSEAPALALAILATLVPYNFLMMFPVPFPLVLGMMLIAIWPPPVVRPSWIEEATTDSW